MIRKLRRYLKLALLPVMVFIVLFLKVDIKQVKGKKHAENVQNVIKPNKMASVMNLSTTTPLPNVTHKEQNLLTYYDPKAVAKLRVERFHKMCTELTPVMSPELDQRLTNQNMDARQFDEGLVSEKFKTVIYFNHKASSMEWFEFFATNNIGKNISKKEVKAVSTLTTFQHGMRKYKLYQSDEYNRVKLQGYYTLLTVQHPLRRIERAYRENMADLNGEWCRKYDQKIVTRFRMMLGKPNHEVAMKMKECVTFEEFVNFLIYYYPRNPHWRPYVEKDDLLSKCRAKLDYIAKSETLQEDMNYISDHNLDGLGKHVASPHSTGMALPLFSALSKAPIYVSMLVQQWYHRDMKLFGYKYEIFNGTVFALCESYVQNKCI